MQVPISPPSVPSAVDLREELRGDVPGPGTDGAAHADLPGALEHGDQRRVRYPHRPDQQADQREDQEQAGQVAVHLALQVQRVGRRTSRPAGAGRSAVRRRRSAVPPPARRRSWWRRPSGPRSGSRCPAAGCRSRPAPCSPGSASRCRWSPRAARSCRRRRRCRRCRRRTRRDGWPGGRGRCRARRPSRCRSSRRAGGVVLVCGQRRARDHRAAPSPSPLPARRPAG